MRYVLPLFLCSERKLRKDLIVEKSVNWRVWVMTSETLKMRAIGPICKSHAPRCCHKLLIYNDLRIEGLIDLGNGSARTRISQSVGGRSLTKDGLGSQQ